MQNERKNYKRKEERWKTKGGRAEGRKGIRTGGQIYSKKDGINEERMKKVKQGMEDKRKGKVGRERKKVEKEGRNEGAKDTVKDRS